MKLLMLGNSVTAYGSMIFCKEKNAKIQEEMEELTISFCEAKYTFSIIEELNPSRRKNKQVTNVDFFFY